MIREQRARAGDAVRDRIRELHSTIPKMAAEAGVGETTLRALVRGTRWPSFDTRQRINTALGWPDGELSRRAIIDFDEAIRAIPTRALLAELERRCCGHGTESVAS